MHPWTNQRSPFRTLSSHISPLVPSPLWSGGRVSDAVVSRRCGVAEADDLPKRSCPSDRFLVHRHAHFSASHPIHKPPSDPPPKQKMAALTANVLKGNKVRTRNETKEGEGEPASTTTLVPGVARAKRYTNPMNRSNARLVDPGREFTGSDDGLERVETRRLTVDGEPSDADPPPTPHSSHPGRLDSTHRACAPMQLADSAWCACLA